MRLCISPDTQAVGSRHRLAVPEQKAAVPAEPGQQHLRHLAPNPPIIDGLDQRPLGLHVAALTSARLRAYSWLHKPQVPTKQENLFFCVFFTLPSLFA